MDKKLQATRIVLLERLIKQNDLDIIRHECSDGMGAWKRAEPLKEENKILFDWIEELRKVRTQ